MSRIIDYDPVGVIPEVRCPVLAIFGENDILVPVPRNATYLRNGLEKGNNGSYEIIIIEGATHGFILAPRCHSWPEVNHTISDELADAIKKWSFLKCNCVI